MAVISAPSRILVLEAGGIGDAVMATPTLTALRRRFPRAHIAVVATPRAADVIRSLHLDFDVRPLRLRSPLAALADLGRLALDSRACRPDMVIDLSSIETNAAALKRRWLVALLGAGTSLGRNTDGRGAFFDHAAAESLFGGPHEVERKLNVLRPLGVTVADPRPLLNVPETAAIAAERALAERGVTELVGMHPGAFLPTRRWPAENFARLAAELTTGPGRGLLVTGGAGEEELADTVTDTVAAAVRVPVIKAVATRLLDAAALVGRCRLFVTNDTGMMHAAAAQGVPVVALFGRTNLARYRPWLPPDRYVVIQQPPESCGEFRPGQRWSECRRPSCPSGRCIKSIRFEDVLSRTRDLIARTASAGQVAAR